MTGAVPPDPGHGAVPPDPGHGAVPPGPGPACTKLAAALSELKARTGLSLAALAARTAYSKSSWGRYLDGKQLAPRTAVESLCGIAGQSPARLVALWELADLEWSGRQRISTAAPSREEREDQGRPFDERSDGVCAAEERPAPGRSAQGVRSRVWTLAAAGCAVAIAATLWVISSLDARTGVPSSAHTVPSALPDPACDARKCTGANPEMMGCATSGRARRIGSLHRTRTGARLSFTYSESCHAAWVLVWKTQVGDAVAVSVAGSGPQRVEVIDRYDAESPLFTPMVDGSDPAELRACFTPAGGGHTECFHR
jgi:hypothetical protein